MNDLRFMIVNSNLEHSQLLLYELQSRVSFDVYQDTEDKDIWKLMEGGKDDIYVYDRCGRLAYYIPFPLSIMTADDGLVPSAILATYYRSPCGLTCDKNSSTSLEDFLDQRDLETNPMDTTAEVVSSTTELYKEESEFNQSEDTFHVFSNQTTFDESPSRIDNTTDYFNYDYPTYNYTTEDVEKNKTQSLEKKSFYNSLLNLFFSQTTQIAESNFTESSNVSLQDSFNQTSTELAVNSPIKNGTQNHSDHDKNDHHSHFLHNRNNIHPHFHHDKNATHIQIVSKNDNVNPITPKPKSDRCVEADLSVCKNWSKRRLLRAHNCCTSKYQDSNDDFCKHFRRKKCKKIQAVLKCCFKTAFLEKTTEIDVVATVPVTTMETTTISPDETAMVDVVTGMRNRITCCLDLKGGRVCRVSPNHTCEGNEYISEEPIANRPNAM